LSLQGSAHWGTASGDGLPLHDWFFLGGSIDSGVWPTQFVPFDGVNSQSIAGRAVRVLQAGVQMEGPAGFMVTARGDVGGVFDATPASEGRAGYRTGVGLSVGRQFAPGPISLTAGTRSLHQRPTVELQFGAHF
jgi:hypothetical protein